jgi:eukaryotic-like serine/threonine-protein kinase
MPLQAGTRVDAYELLGPLGAGGMGEVYKARDTRLDRLVALKVLPNELTADREARERLDREARTLASISHSHVCALFELTEHEQHSVLVMEYLQGTTLAQRLRAGRLKLSECMRIAAEIADGLSAAHRAGIVHRDVKPENIMLTSAGVKLLDFGLAKPQIAPLHGGTAETVTGAQLTRAGTIAGTLPYMAPEQLDGREADARTDIWAFGCVLYEMVTGRRAFDGEGPARVIATILDPDLPPPPSALQPAATGALDRVIRKCLAKDPEARWQTAQDLRDELTWIAAGMASPGRSGLSRTVAWRHRMAGVIAGAALASSALLIAQPWRSPQPEAPVSHFEVTVPRLAMEHSLALSPDGRQLAFVATDAQGHNLVWVRSMADAAPRPLSGTDGAAAGVPIWSPDGRSLAFVSGNKLRKTDVAAGNAVALADISGDVFGGAWGADGTILLGTLGGLHRASATGGPVVPLVRLEDGAILHASPQFLPDGRRFLYMSWAFDEDRRELCLGSLDHDVGRCLGIKLHYFAGFTSGGYLVYARGGTLFGHPFDVAAARPTGEPIVLAEQLAQDFFGRTSVSLAGASTLVYQTTPAEIRQFVWFDRAGRHDGAAGEPGVFEGFDMTARGEQVLAQRADPGGTALWLIDIARGTTTRAVTAVEEGHRALATAADYNRMLAPVFAGDGQRFFYRTRRSGRAAIVERPTRGGEERVIYEYPGDAVLVLADVSDDGRWLAIGLADARPRVAVVPLTGGDPIVFAESGALGLASPRLSPDGRFVAYTSWESGASQVYVSPLPPTGERSQVSTTGGLHPAWRGDGRELFYFAPDGSLMSVVIAEGTTFDAGVPSRLFSATTAGLPSRIGYRVTADGERFLVSTLREGDKTATTTTLQVVLNWTAALRR